MSHASPAKSKVTTRPGNNSSPTGRLEYRCNSYCEVRNAVFDINHVVMVKEGRKAVGFSAMTIIFAAFMGFITKNLLLSSRILIYDNTICEEYGKYY